MGSWTLNAEEKGIYDLYSGLALPRHTSYPIAPTWSDEYGRTEFGEDLRDLGTSKKPLSLYLHVPYCQKLCFYCACSKEIRPKEAPGYLERCQDYVKHIIAEINQCADYLQDNQVTQVHFGGGTPTYIPQDQMARIVGLLRSKFSWHPEAEVAIEIDPRTVTHSYLKELQGMGFNRISLGVQEFEPKIQEAINRVQPHSLVSDVVSEARQLGFVSINFDLIYGLPFQTQESLQKTLELVTELSPDRIAFYRLAVIPEIFKWQKSFLRTDMPDADLTLALNLQAIEYFEKNDYEFIGLDHFAKRDEALHQSREDGSLRRTFQGMTTGGTTNVIGFGPSAISILESGFAQNPKDVATWKAQLADGHPTHKGRRLTPDDRRRQSLLQELYGYGKVDIARWEKDFDQDFELYFAAEMPALNELESQGVIDLSGKHLHVSRPLGQLLLRVVAAVFDNYLPKNAYKEGLQKAKASQV